MKKFISFLIALLISAGLYAQTDVLPPMLVAPTDGATNQMADALMDWYAVAGIGSITYELQYDTSSSFVDPVSMTTEFSSAKAEKLLFGTTYYWRVRAMDNLGTSEWSEVFHFNTFIQLELNKPNNNAENQTPEIDIEWKVKYSGKSVTGITLYDYQVAYDTSFSEMFFSGSMAYVATTANTLKHVISLMHFDTTYYWRVRARHDADAMIWSETWSYKTTDQCVHEIPANGATGQMLNVTVKWQAMRGAYEYIYEICDDPSFNAPCIFFSNTNTITAMGLIFGETYYWRVKAAHTADTSSWSEPWTFETLNSVNLNSPANGTYVNDFFPLLTWQALTGIQGFQLEFDDNQDFTDPTVDMISGDKNSHKILFALELEKTYFWRVRAYETGDTTNWSPVWSFIVGEGPQGINDLLSDHTVSIYPNPAKNDLFIEVNALEQIQMEVSVLNLLGQTVVNERFNLSQGMNKNQINLPALEGGLYIIQMKSGDEMFMKKLVIDR